MNKTEQYLQSQMILFRQSFKVFKSNNNYFKDLTHYMKHRRLLKRLSFMFGNKQMDDSLGKNFDKNRLKQMKRKFK